MQLVKLEVTNFVRKIGLTGFSIADSSCNSSFKLPVRQSCWRSCISSTAIVAPTDMKVNNKVLLCLISNLAIKTCLNWMRSFMHSAALYWLDVTVHFHCRVVWTPHWKEIRNPLLRTGGSGVLLIQKMFTLPGNLTALCRYSTAWPSYWPRLFLKYLIMCFGIICCYRLHGSAFIRNRLGQIWMLYLRFTSFFDI